MKHVIIRTAGRPETMCLEPVTLGPPADQDVLIEVSACGVNFPDLVIRRGTYRHGPKLPFVPGYEVAGRIQEIGKNVTDFKQGDKVFATLGGGGYASHVMCPSNNLFRIPIDMSDDEASVISISYLTAWLSIDRLAGVRRGETVAIHSAGGGVGLAALQICLARGARVIAIANESKHARLRFLGADVCIALGKENLAAHLLKLTDGKGVDVTLDSTGGKYYQQSYDGLASLGRLILLGGAGGVGNEAGTPVQLSGFWHPAKRLDPSVLMTANKSVCGLNLPALWSRNEICVEAISEILSLYELGHVMPIIDSVFALEDAAEAHRLLHARRNFGKVVLRP